MASVAEPAMSVRGVGSCKVLPTGLDEPGAEGSEPRREASPLLRRGFGDVTVTTGTSF
jgi:hypothetical protein